MPNYNQSTRQRIEDIALGMRVETDALDVTAWQTQDRVTRLFTVTGRILVAQLYGEVTTVLGGAGAPVMKFRCAFTTPVIGAADLSANSGDISSHPVGGRVTCTGTTVATAAALTASAGVSYGTVAPIVFGLENGIGWIGIVTSTAAIASGAIKYFLNYVPLSTGANAVTEVAVVT